MTSEETVEEVPGPKEDKEEFDFGFVILSTPTGFRVQPLPAETGIVEPPSLDHVHIACTQVARTVDRQMNAEATGQVVARTMTQVAEHLQKEDRTKKLHVPRGVPTDHLRKGNIRG